MFHVYAGNVPSIPIWPMLSALLLKSALLAKTSAQEPVLAPHLARAIAEEDDSLGECLAVVWWKGGTAELERAALEAAPAVLAFGGQAAIATIARGARADAKLVLHGPKVSLAYVGKGPSRARAPSPRRAGSRSTSPSTTSRAASRRTRSTPSGGERDAGRLRGSDGGGARVGRGRSSCGTGACRRAGVGATLPRAGAVRRRGRSGDPARRARRRDALDGGLRERRALRARSGAPHGPRARDHRPRGIRAGPRAFGRVRRGPRPGRGVPPPRGARRAVRRWGFRGSRSRDRCSAPRRWARTGRPAAASVRHLVHGGPDEGQNLGFKTIRARIANTRKSATASTLIHRFASPGTRSRSPALRSDSRRPAGLPRAAASSFASG